MHHTYSMVEFLNSEFRKIDNSLDYYLKNYMTESPLIINFVWIWYLII